MNRYHLIAVVLLLSVLCVTSIWSQTYPETTTINVPALSIWTNTGLFVSAGKAVTITASGTWCWYGSGWCNGPDGHPNHSWSTDEHAVFDYFDHGRLIAYIGSDPYQGRAHNQSFFPQTSGYISVGSGQTFVAPYSGNLWLGLNDDLWGGIGDNSGQLLASVTVNGNDPTAPSIKIVNPSKVYLQNQRVLANYSCTDVDDSVQSCAGTVANGTAVDTSSTGQHMFTVVARDSNGNSSSKTLAYVVGNFGLMPQGLVFQPQLVGLLSKGQRVVLLNRLKTPLAISGIGTTGDFIYSTLCGSAVPAHSSCSVNLTFKPTSSGVKEGTFGVNTGAGSTSIRLVGFGTPVRLSPARVAFAIQTVGTTSIPKIVTLKNGQTVTLNVVSLNVTGDFSLATTTTCPTAGPIAAGASCKIALAFSPSLTGTRTGTLIVQSDYPTTPVLVSLTGTGQ